MANFQISMTSVALQVGARAFAGMKDKTGCEGAFLHSMRVEALVAKTGAGDIARAAALLHDVIEDTPTTVEDIRKEFTAYPPEDVEKMIETILSVTRGYIHRDTGTLFFEPPYPENICDCKFRKCLSAAHRYDKELYRDFVMRSKRHPLGRIIKIADITDNSSASRIEGLSEEEKGIVEEHYIPALAYLKDDKATEYFSPRQLARLCRWCSKPFSEHINTPERKCPPGSLLFEDPQRSTFKGVKN